MKPPVDLSTLTPVERAAYQRGIEDARTVFRAATMGVVDRAFAEVIDDAFRDIKRLVAPVNGYIELGHGVDYVEIARQRARRNVPVGAQSGWGEVKTPVGLLTCLLEITETGKWTSTYYVDSQRTSVRSMRAIGLAQRPTTRNRKPKNGS